MIALYDHIQELRLELRHCYMTRKERRAMEQELAAAIAQHTRLENDLDEIFVAPEAERG